MVLKPHVIMGTIVARNVVTRVSRARLVARRPIRLHAPPVALHILAIAPAV